MEPIQPIEETRAPQRLYVPSRAALRPAGSPAAAGSSAEPWTTDHPWRPAGQDQDYLVDSRGPWLGRGIAVALIGLANLALLSHIHLLENLAVILDLFGVVILFDLLLRLRQSLRRTRLRWTTFPAFTGGRLEGVLTARPVLEPIGPVRAVLRCVRDRRTGEAAALAAAFEPTVLYQQISEINIAEDRMKELPLSFAVPPDLPGTDLGRDEATYWQVALRIPVVGPDVEIVFLAPVYSR